MPIHTSGPAPGLSYSEAWWALDAADVDAVVVDCPTKPVRVGDLQAWLFCGKVTPQVVGTYLTLAGIRIPAICSCSHPPTDHDGQCTRPACGCREFRPSS